MVITSLPSIRLGQHAVLTLPKAGGSDWRLAVWETNAQRETGNRMIGWGAQGRADHPWSAAGAGQGRQFAAGRTEVGARFIVTSVSEGVVKPRPYPRPPCGGHTVERGRSTLPN